MQPHLQALKTNSTNYVYASEWKKGRKSLQKREGKISFSHLMPGLGDGEHRCEPIPSLLTSPYILY